MPGKFKTGLITAVVVTVLGTAGFFARDVLNLPVKGIPEGWSAVVGSPDDWTWKEGRIHAHGEAGESMLLSSRTYNDVTLSANATSTNREASFVVRASDAANGYLVIFVPSNTPWRRDTGWIELVKRESGKDYVLGRYNGRVMSTMGYTANIAAIAKGPWLEIRLNDVTVIRVKDTTFPSGYIGLRIFGKQNQPCDASYSYLKFR